MSSYPSRKEAAELICEIGKKMYMKQFVSANDGNMTIRVGDDTVVATPTGISKGDLTPEMLLLCNFDGKILDGTYKPTSELPMHLRTYREDDKIMSTAHAHPCFLNCIANLGAELDMALTPATAAISGRIPVVPYCNPGSDSLANAVAPYVKDYSIVMLANHGPIAWGKNPIEAWYILEDAEAYAKMAVIQKFIIGSYRPISKGQIQTLADTHDLTINPKRLVNAPESTTNTEPAFSFNAMDTGVHLDDASVEKVARRVAEILGK